MGGFLEGLYNAYQVFTSINLTKEMDEDVDEAISPGKRTYDILDRKTMFEVYSVRSRRRIT